MSNQDSDEQKKVEQYLQIIRLRILAPIQNTEVRKYCTATLLLLFAAIDGLGKLLHDDSEAESASRIRRFLDYMEGNYSARQNELVRLRRSLVHNALNAESFLSNAEEGDVWHLQLLRIGDEILIYVNTMTMYADLLKAFSRFENEIRANPKLMKQAADRLEYVEATPWDDPNMPSPTSPPPIGFIRTKKKRG